MGASIILLSLFLFCFLRYPHFTVGIENCANARCSKDEPVISYPFRIKGRQDERCGYPGFDLTCGNMNRTVLDLPFSEPFFVNNIIYGSTFNEIELEDPDNCLAGRLLNQLNLSGTPFIGIEYQNYSFFSCQSHTHDPAKDISCLGNATHRVFARAYSTSTSSSSWPRANCTLIATVPVPVLEYVSGPYEYPRFPSTDVLHLTWNWKAPYCKRNCHEKSNFLSFRNHDVSNGNISLIVIGVVLPMVIATVLCYMIFTSQGFLSGGGGGTEQTNYSSSQLVTITTVLDGSAVQSFPTIVLAEGGRLPNYPGNSTCAICLSEYQPKETLKTLPLCNHCFHVDCIDVWLRLNSTCPVCRIAPVKLLAT